MKPYKIFCHENEITGERGGLCPRCQRITGWHVHPMGIVLKEHNIKAFQIDPESARSLGKIGCAICKLDALPGIFINTCMACKDKFYDYAYRYKENACENGRQYLATRIGLVRIWPPGLPCDIPKANADLPENCQEFYKEAAGIFAVSPRSAAVLLRLCLQCLLNHLGFKGTISEMISVATQKLNLPNHIQQFMDVVRYHGNEAAHSSDLELNPNEQTENVVYMFSVINEIANYAITLPNESNESFAKLPENIRQAIEKRDKKGS